ncbi:MAG: acid phosphatase pho5 [Pleopsidium flavum]|nr:MAG: acid phosphatase pho5 [Pleopsidium flavum]
MSRLHITFSALVCLLGFIVFFLTRNSTPSPLPVTSGVNEPLSLAAFYSKIPYTSSWGSWWHPQRSHGRGSSEIGKGWNILYHLGGNGPWIEKIEGVVKGGIGVPKGCRVEQVHMMSRHAERFPTKNAGSRMLDLLRRIKDANTTLKGDLEFVNGWEYFTDDPDKHLEQLTTTGPFAGTLEAFTTGVKLRTRYNHLLNASRGHKKTRLWASDSNRVIDTARYFSAGFFGLDWEDTADLKVIPETDDLGADTLTPGDTCLQYRDDPDHGHDHGLTMLTKFRSTYLPSISTRLSHQNPQLRFTDAEIYSMQEMCGFETLVRGSSPWCDVFTHKDWLDFEYARDVIHYYRAGPGNPYGPVMGWLWLNATANLMAAGPGVGSMFFSFVHDGDIVPMLAALDLFHDDDLLPVTHVAVDRRWRTSPITPMGGRFIFERLACPSSSSSTSAGGHADIFIRININDGIVSIPGCKDGPGKSCALDRFLEIVKRRGEEVGDFRKKCGLREDAADRITFLHQ